MTTTRRPAIAPSPLPRPSSAAKETQPTPPVDASRKPLWRRLGGNRVFWISVGAHLLFGLVAAVLVVQNIATKRKLTFTAAPPNPNPSQRALEHKVQVAKKQNNMSAPAQPKRIVATGAAKFTLPEMPSMPSMSTDFMPGKMPGMGGTGLGFSPAGGFAGGGGGRGGPIPFFGLRNGGAGLAGTFYDLKQTRDGKPNGMAIVEQNWQNPKEEPANKQYGSEVSSFIKNGLSESSLDKFFRGPTTLYATQFFIPTMSANEAPKAFQVEGKAQPRRWIAVYRGKVIPPESGSYRFVGAGDDVLVVRFNGRVVLDAGCNGVKGPPSISGFQRTGAYRFDRMGGATPQAWQGTTFDVRADTAYSMEVVIGEWPGGEGAFCLLLEKMGAEYGKDSHGNPLLPVFKLGASEVKPGGLYMPVFAPDTSWSLWKAQPVRSLFGGN